MLIKINQPYQFPYKYFKVSNLGMAYRPTIYDYMFLEMGAIKQNNILMKLKNTNMYFLHIVSVYDECIDTPSLRIFVGSSPKCKISHLKTLELYKLENTIIIKNLKIQYIELVWI